MRRRQSGQYRIGFDQRVSRQDEILTGAGATLDFAMGSRMVFVPCTHRRHQTTGVAEVAVQSESLAVGFGVSYLDDGVLNLRFLQDRVFPVRHGNHKVTAALQ